MSLTSPYPGPGPPGLDAITADHGPFGPAVDRNAPPSVHLRRRLELQQAQRAGVEPAAVQTPRRAPVSRTGGNGSVTANNRLRASRQEIEMPENY